MPSAEVARWRQRDDGDLYSSVQRGTLPPRVTHTTDDDAFHEIQLNGKQLVFLVMAGTVVFVVIFLCGVLVGRGVRIERTALAAAGIETLSPAADVLPPGMS